MSRQIGAFDSLIPAPKDGESPKVLELSPPLIAIPVDSTTRQVIGEQSFTIEVRILQDNEALELNNDYFCETNSITDIQSAVSSDFQVRKFLVDIWTSEGVVKSSPIDVVTVTAGIKGVFSVSSTITLCYVQRGLIGKTGPFLKPCGYWDVNGDYTIKNNMPPLVMYPKSADGLYYVRTENPIRYKSDKKTPLDPATDYATYSGTGAWLLMEGYDALYAHFLMADWARFGNAEGGVFWAHYLFSSMGLLAGGTNAVDYSVCENEIFDAITKKLTGNWTPNLFLDFKTGGSKFGKLSESFLRINTSDDPKKQVPLWRISMDSCHNIAHSPIIYNHTNSYKAQYKPCVVMLPSSYDSAWTEDGTHCTILHEYDYHYAQAPESNIYRNAVLVVCADSRFLDAGKYTELNSGVNGSSMDGWIIWKGRRCKFVFLTPGMMLHLRSSITTDENGNRSTVWFVENSGEFELLDTCIEWHPSYSKTSSKCIRIYNDSDRIGDVTGLGRVIGSPILNNMQGDGDFLTSWIFDAAGGGLDTSGYRNYYMWHRE